jgi:hypothetical protein
MKSNVHALKLAAIFFIVLLGSCNKNDRLRNSVAATKTDLVPISVARGIAENFNPNTFYNFANGGNRAGVGTSLKGNNRIQSSITIKDKDDIPALYVFNFDEGYMIISADYQLEPIQAFVPKGTFQRENQPCGPEMWLNQKVGDVEILRKGQYDNSKLASKAWEAALANRPTRFRDFSRSDVRTNIIPPEDNPCAADPNYTNVIVSTWGPLIQTVWGQGCSFNNMLTTSVSCTSDPCGMPPVGCVATAAAQVMNYWQAPATYNYTAMPQGSTGTTGNTAVQLLMRDVSTAVGTSYSCSGSGAYLWDVEYALENVFGYSNATWKNYNRTSGGDYQIALNNIKSNMPVLFAGYDASVGGHAWVSEGAQETLFLWCDGNNIQGTGYLHFYMNWGWYGGSNGWYSFTNWSLPSMAFHAGNQLLYDIHP